MNTENNGEFKYRVVVVATAKAALRQMFEEYAEEGEGPAFREVLERLFERLRKSPHEFGEPLYRLPALQ